MASFNADDISIKIYNSKSKLSFLFLIVVGFGAAGAWVAIDAPNIFRSSIHHTPIFEIQLVGTICVVASIIGIVICVFKFFTNAPSLIVDENGVSVIGLTNNHVDWDDISRFDIDALTQANVINIYLANPREFIEKRSKNWLSKLMPYSFKEGEAHVSIDTDTLQCELKELYDLLTTRLDEYKETEKITHYHGK